MAKDNSLRVAVRVVGWSQWQVQVIRGVQAYAHQQPRWRLYVDGTPATASSIFGGDVRWDGILTRDHDMHSLWRRLMREGRTQVISLTSSPAKGNRFPACALMMRRWRRRRGNIWLPGVSAFGVCGSARMGTAGSSWSSADGFCGGKEIAVCGVSWISRSGDGGALDFYHRREHGSADALDCAAG